MTDDQLVLGIDGGGTKTVARIARHDAPVAVLGEGRAGPSNWLTHGPEVAMQAVIAARDAAFKDAGIANHHANCTCIALAGAGSAAARATVVRHATAAGLADTIRVVHDAEPVLAAAFPDCIGIALLSGTGSIAFGRAADGTTARAGGHGAAAGDLGSAFAIASAAIRASIVTEPPDITDTRSVAALAPAVIAAAQSGNTAAAGILDDAARALAALVRDVARELALEAPIPLALAGGVLVGSESIRGLFTSALDLDHAPTTIVENPVDGCLRLAALPIKCP
ncbi:MAG: BadF/BadG/BcrA/BcrD ATPase family protein [Planctomycetota bacterium]|jgi:N-acetylglucosamine kinase-like BadF-type ATPase|nr:BadF/BadG/BcrA/BcrD ATPase family protein [Planctomycetota bacterium]